MAKATLTISSKNYSSWSLRGWLLTRFSGLEFEELVTAPDDASARAEILLLSSSILVPCLRHEGATVWDTLAIAEYLYETHPEMWPKNSKARATARSVSAEMHAGFVPLRKAMPMNIRTTGRRVESTPELDADIARIKSIWRELRKQYASTGPWLFGQYSIADAMFAPVDILLMTQTGHQ